MRHASPEPADTIDRALSAGNELVVEHGDVECDWLRVSPELILRSVMVERFMERLQENVNTESGRLKERFNSTWTNY